MPCGLNIAIAKYSNLPIDYVHRYSIVLLKTVMQSGQLHPGERKNLILGITLMIIMTAKKWYSKVVVKGTILTIASKGAAVMYVI